jgi:hypothetical protein
MTRAETPDQHFKTKNKTCKAHSTAPIASLREEIVSGDHSSAYQQCQKHEEDEQLRHPAAAR